MPKWTTRGKRWRLILGFAVLGFAIGAIIWAYSELRDASPPQPGNPVLISIFMFLCPPSFLSFPLIDVEPGSRDFRILWFALALINSALYAAIAAIVSLLRWGAKDRTAPSED